MMREDAHLNAAVYYSSQTKLSGDKGKDLKIDSSMLIKNINSKFLLKEMPTSSIYQAKIDNQNFIYKVIRKNSNMDFNLVFQSYENYTRLRNKEGLVEVYDYQISEDGENFEILMEYLDNYFDLQNIVHENRSDYADKVLAIIENVVNQELIPVDCGLANFVTDGDKVKMLDLDFMLCWHQVSYFNTIWFLSRLDEIIEWYPAISKQIDTFKFEFNRKKKLFFDSIPYNPLAVKYNEDGENLLMDGQNENAVEMFYKSLESYPFFAAPYNNLAVAFWNLGEISRTEQLLKVAMEIEPNNQIFRDNYLDVLNFQEKYDEIKKVHENQRNLRKSDNKSTSNNYEIISLQKEIDQYSYPSNYAYDIMTLKPKGTLETRVDYFVKYCPEIFEPCKKFLSVGSSLGYMLLFHSHRADKCTGIEPDGKANEIVKKVAAFRNVNNIELFLGTFKEFEKKEVYDLIWMGNVFQYMYVDFGWKVAEELAKISSGKCIIEAPFEGEYLKQQAHLNSNWKNEKLMNDYKFERFESEMANYFDIVSVNPSGTDPVNRLIVVLSRKKSL